MDPRIIWIIVGILVIETLIWIPILIWVRRRASAVAASMRDEITLSGEKAVIEPELAIYGGGTGNFRGTRGSCTIALTDRRIVFQKLKGTPEEIRLADVQKLEENKWFLKCYRNGRQHMILHLRDESMVGFMVKDHARWMAEVAARIRQDTSGETPQP